MTLTEALATLEALADPKVRAHNTRYGAPDTQFGVKMGDIRAIAKKIKKDHDLALALWGTGNVDACLLSTLIIDIKRLTADDLDRMVKSVTFTHVADWLMSYVIKQHPAKDSLRHTWMQSTDPMALRAGWSLTAACIEKDPAGIDAAKLLDRIESELGSAHPHAQWTMNAALAQIGIHVAILRARAIDIGERLGVYRDFPVSKGCTSPFAPIWIGEMVKRQKSGRS